MCLVKCWSFFRLSYCYVNIKVGINQPISRKMHYCFYGMRRSGNHAVINWLMKCLDNGRHESREISRRLTVRGDCCHLNALNEYKNADKLNEDLKFARSNFSNLIISFEDVSPERFSGETWLQSASFVKIILIRDILNLAASRYARSRCSEFARQNNTCNVDSAFVSLWLEHVNLVTDNSHDSAGIIFERWLDSKSYRQKVCDRLMIDFAEPDKAVSRHGGGSSFVGMDRVPTSAELKSRKDQIVLPKDAELLLGSKDVREARSKLGYV